MSGMTVSMQQGSLPVGSVAQTLPMAGMPQTISMVQQIHPLGGMAQPGTLLGQINSTQHTQNTAMQTLQQQPQTLVSGNLVQTSVGMAVQQPTLSHTTQMQTSGLTLEGASLLPASLVQVTPAILHHEVAPP
ncbi:hypothetical protein O0L34_g2565 [Tuta absoluta]|nr:hypothetical protein O0L34_g2565 [Tuta absoluta]